MLKSIQMEATPLLRSLNVVRSLNAAQIALKVAHEGYHHSPYDWFIFDARMTSPKTCEVCKWLNLRDFRGDWIPIKFPWHTHMGINAIRAKVHRYCRCILRYAGRALQIYESPFGLLTPEEVQKVWQPTEQELEKLTPSQFQMIFRFIRSPYKA